MSKFLKTYLETYKSASPKALLALLESQDNIDKDLRSLLMMRAYDGESFTYDEYVKWEDSYKNAKEEAVDEQSQFDDVKELSLEEIVELRKTRNRLISRVTSYSKNLNITTLRLIIDMEQYFDYKNKEFLIAVTQEFDPSINYTTLFVQAKEYMKHVNNESQPEKEDGVYCDIIDQHNPRFTKDHSHFYLLANAAWGSKIFVGAERDENMQITKFKKVESIEDAEPLLISEVDYAKIMLTQNVIEGLTYHMYMLEEVAND